MAGTLKIPQASLKHVEDLFAQGLGARPTMRLDLYIADAAVAKRALIWEWGRITCKPGPKTMWGTNPDGERRVMTKTAPSGFIRSNRDKARAIAHAEIQKRLRWKAMKMGDIPKAIEWGLRNAAPKIADLIADAAPIDTGALRDNIRGAIPHIQKAVPVDEMAIRTRAHYEG